MGLCNLIETLVHTLEAETVQKSRPVCCILGLVSFVGLTLQEHNKTLICRLIELCDCTIDMTGHGQLYSLRLEGQVLHKVVDHLAVVVRICVDEGSDVGSQAR